MSRVNNKAILLYGNIPDTINRSKILVEFLNNSEFKVLTVCPDSYLRYIPKIIKDLKWAVKFATWVHLIDFFIKVRSVNLVYLLPSNTRFIRVALLGSKVFSKRLVVEMYISAYDSLRDRGLAKNRSIAALRAMSRDRLALTKADYIIHTSNHELSYWERILNINLDKRKVKISPLCNSCDISIIRKRNFMEDRVLKICWWGTFIPLHGLENIIYAMKILKKENLRFSCTLFGIDNPLFLTYEQKIIQEKLSNHVVLRKDLSFGDGSLPHYLSNNCDLALGIFGDTEKARNAIPNKLIEALSMEIPTLTMASSALQEFFNPATDLWVCQPSPESIAKSIIAIISDLVFPVDWKQTRKKVVDIFSVDQYQKVVATLLNQAIAN
jgi:glycosyltransferase involved in cell wall biosynthesis